MAKMQAQPTLFYITCKHINVDLAKFNHSCLEKPQSCEDKLSTGNMNNHQDFEYYPSEGEENYPMPISHRANSNFVRCNTNSGSAVSDFGSDGAAVNSPVGLTFDSSEWSDDDDDDECFVSDSIISKSAYRKSWTDSGVSSTKTDSQPGSLVNRVKRPSAIDLGYDLQRKNIVVGSSNERRSLREVKRSNRTRHSRTSQDHSFDEDDIEVIKSRGIPACDGTSTLMKELSTWTPKEREILCQVLENARDVGVSKKSTTKDVLTPKKSSKKKELLDYPLSKYRDGDCTTPTKSNKSIMSGLRKISLGLKRRKDSTSNGKRKDSSTKPQNIVYQDYISRYLDPSDESDISDDEADEISHLANAPKKIGLFKRVFQRRTSRSYLATSALPPPKARDSSPRSLSATPRLRRNRSQSTRSIPDSFRGLFSRKRCQSVESLHGPRRRLPRSRSVISLALRSPIVQSSQRFGGSSVSLSDKSNSKEVKCYRRYDSVRSLIQPTQYDVVTHLIGDTPNHRQPGADINDCNLEKVRRRRMSTGQRTPKGYTLNEFFPTATESVKIDTDFHRCHDIGYESCYDDGLLCDDESICSSTDHERSDSIHEMVVAPLQIRHNQSLVASKRQITYSQNSCFV